MQSMRHDEAFMPYTQVPHTSHRSQIIQIFFSVFPVVADDVFQLHGGKSYSNCGDNNKIRGRWGLIIKWNTIYKNHLDLFGRYVTYTAKGNWKRAALPF